MRFTANLCALATIFNLAILPVKSLNLPPVRFSRIVRKISGCTEEDPCKQSVDLVASSRCDRRDRDAGAARDGFERGEQGPMPRGRLAAVA